jgi:Cupin-like domain/SCP-2 sterol transfer family
MTDNLSESLSQLFSYAVPMELHGTYQFVFPDVKDANEPNAVWIRVGRENVEVREGSGEHRDVEIRVGRQDLRDLLSGKLDIAKLFTSGKIQVQGKMSLAEELPVLVDFWRKGASSELVALYPWVQKRRFPSRRRASEELAAKQPKLTDIDRRSELSVAEFERDYLAHGIPVILPNYTAKWPLMQMSREELKGVLGGAQGIVVQQDYVKDKVNLKRGSVPMSYAEFIDRLNDPSTASGPPPYMANSPIPEALYPFIEFPPYYPRELYQLPKLWLGAGGTYSGLHRDGTDNLYVQVWGRKRFLLASPDEWKYFYTWSTDLRGGLEGCDVDPENPDLDRFPLFAQANIIKVDLSPGDMLYLPEGWFHHVRSLSLSLSINFWPRVARGTAAWLSPVQ